MTATPAPAQPTSPTAWLHRFCENWIYAFLIAFALKHFLIEPFRIPSASMEPMMYGDPSITKGDLVVVDKLVSRFRPYQRFDVAVFQFPLPELEWPGDARPATDAEGERIDHPLLAPLYGRNFVKRIIGLPGDEFFIQSGNLYLKGSDGKFSCAHKPPQVQEAVWLPMYRHGEQPGYLPWAGPAGTTATTSGDRLTVDLGSDAGSRAIAFTQPIINLYMKPGTFKITPWAGGQLQGGPELIEVSMTKPVFTYQGRQGNVWDFDNWYISRMNSADLDNAKHGTNLNALMDERVGDVRATATIAAITGEPKLVIDLGSQQQIALNLAADRWSVVHTLIGGERLAGQELAHGGAPAGLAIAIAHIDDQAVVQLDGAEVARFDVPRFDTATRAVTIRFEGSGRAELSGLAIDRDLHWSRRGFLVEGRPEVMALANELGSSQSNAMSRAKAKRDGDLIPAIRAQLRGKTVDELRGAENTAPIACDEQHPGRIPAGSYLLLGDNSPHSWDGRNWGLVPAENLRGRAVAIAFPFWRMRAIR